MTDTFKTIEIVPCEGSIVHSIANSIVKHDSFITNLQKLCIYEFRKYYFDHIVTWLKSDYPAINIKDLLTKIFGFLVFHSVIPKLYKSEIKSLSKQFHKHGLPTKLQDEQRAERKRIIAREYYKRRRDDLCRTMNLTGIRI